MKYRVNYKYIMTGYVDTEADSKEQAEDIMWHAIQEELDDDEFEKIISGPKEFIEGDYEVTNIEEIN